MVLKRPKMVATTTIAVVETRVASKCTNRRARELRLPPCSQDLVLTGPRLPARPSLIDLEATSLCN